MPSRLRLQLTEEWVQSGDDGGWTGSLAMTVDGKPASASGNHLVSPRDGGSRLLSTGQATVRLPIIGGRAAREADKLVAAVLNDRSDLARQN